MFLTENMDKRILHALLTSNQLPLHLFEPRAMTFTYIPFLGVTVNPNTVSKGTCGTTVLTLISLLIGRTYLSVGSPDKAELLEHLKET